MSNIIYPMLDNEEDYRKSLTFLPSQTIVECVQIGKYSPLDFFEK